MEKQRVLLAHGNTDCLKIYGTVLAFEGYVVDVADDMRSALAQLAAARYDAVIADLYLTGDDCDECLIRVMRALPAAAHLPVIVLTGWTADVQRQLAMKYGADRFLTLPIRPRELASILADVLGPRPHNSVQALPSVTPAPSPPPSERPMANGF